MSYFFIAIITLLGLPISVATPFISNITGFHALTSLPLSSFILLSISKLNYLLILRISSSVSVVLFSFAILNVLQIGFRKDLILFYMPIFCNLLIFLQSVLLRVKFSSIPSVRIACIIIFLLFLQLLGFLFSPSSVSTQVFSTQSLPIASLLVLSAFFDFNNYHYKRLSWHILLLFIPLPLLFLLQARVSFIVYFCIFLLYILSKIFYFFPALRRFFRTVIVLLLPVNLLSIFFTLCISFFVYCSINLIFFNSFISTQGSVTSVISSLEACNVSSNLVNNEPFICDRLPEVNQISDVSILVRAYSDYVFVSDFIKSPLSFIAPLKLLYDSDPYSYRTHNIVIFWLQNFGFFGLISLTFMLYLCHKFIVVSTPLTLSTVSLPVILICLFTLNDLLVFLPFIIYQPRLTNSC